MPGHIIHLTKNTNSNSFTFIVYGSAAPELTLLTLGKAQEATSTQELSKMVFRSTQEPVLAGYAQGL